MKDWYRTEGQRNHLADFPEKDLTDFFSVTSGGVLQMGAWRFKNKQLRYDYKLHCMCYIDDVKQLKQLYVLKTVKVHVLRLLKNIFYVTAMP
jgi:hypothetical protein